MSSTTRVGAFVLALLAICTLWCDLSDTGSGTPDGTFHRVRRWGFVPYVEIATVERDGDTLERSTSVRPLPLAGTLMATIVAMAVMVRLARGFERPATEESPAT